MLWFANEHNSLKHENQVKFEINIHDEKWMIPLDSHEPVTRVTIEPRLTSTSVIEIGEMK